MVDHFHEQVMALGKIKGQARAMVVTGGIARRAVLPCVSCLPGRTQSPIAPSSRFPASMTSAKAR